jgi:exopolyphosphatase/guanosine-5'-triphosphate,3'-diphosphate pyrophosphatase
VRTAVVDIGTNSTRLLVADVEAGRVTAELARRTAVTRLGAGVDTDGRLRDDAMARVYSTLDLYRLVIEELAAERLVAVLTSAVRDAANGREFADSLREFYDLEPHVLSGDEEASMTFAGAMSERDPADREPTLVVDIGGGSTELVIGAGREMRFHVSTQAGVVRQSERHLHSDPPGAAELDTLAEDLKAIIAAAIPGPQRRAVTRAIGVAGTATSLAAIAQRLEPYDPAKVQGYVVSAAERDRILAELAAVPLEVRRQIPGLDPARAPTIVAGIVILREVMDLFGLDAFEVSEHDILRGAALALA